MYKGKIVCSLVGHDKGIFSVVVGQTDKGLLVCDGKLHRLCNPKLKNIKHLRFTEYFVDTEHLTDKNIRKAIFNKLGTYKEEKQCQKRI